MSRGKHLRKRTNCVLAGFPTWGETTDRDINKTVMKCVSFFVNSLCHLYGQVDCLSTIWLVLFIYLFVTVFGKAAFRELLYKKANRICYNEWLDQ